jgi:hypothetical protein
MLTAVYAARNIVGEKNDVWSVNTEMEYHEEVRATSSTRGDRLVPERVSAPPLTPSAILPDRVIDAAFARLDPVGLGAALGVLGGALIFLATAILLLKGGVVIGPTLSLLGNYFLGFGVSWPGAFVGLVEGSLGGFALGYVLATSRNWGMAAYAFLLRRRAEAELNRDLLEKL